MEIVKSGRYIKIILPVGSDNFLTNGKGTIFYFLFLVLGVLQGPNAESCFCHPGLKECSD